MAVIERALAKTPADRFPSAADFISALSAAAAGPAAPADRSFRTDVGRLARSPCCRSKISAARGGHVSRGGHLRRVDPRARPDEGRARHRAHLVISCSVSGRPTSGRSAGSSTSRRSSRARCVVPASAFGCRHSSSPSRTDSSSGPGGYDREVEDVFALQEDLAGAIAAALQRDARRQLAHAGDHVRGLRALRHRPTSLEQTLTAGSGEGA